MDIDFEKMSRLNAELGEVLNKKKTANDAPKEVQECLLLLTYHFADLVLSNKNPKEALKTIPKEFREDVQAVGRMIHSYRGGRS